MNSADYANIADNSYIADYARLMPKVELHVHLEGSIRPKTLLELARRNLVQLPAQDEEGLKEYFRFRDFDHFIEVYFTITSCLRTPNDYTLIAYEFGCDCARQNIRYAEVTFTMTTNMRFTGLSWQAILHGLNEGRDRAHREFGVDWRWIFDINRNHPESQGEAADIALAARPYGVVALGLGGSEADFPGELFHAPFERARQEALHRVPHAGETQGAQSVWCALNLLHAERIGHGVRAIEDPNLVQTLQQKRIPVEICPTSNIRLGIYPNYQAHPLRRLWDHGVVVTVNSDDPALFGVDLNHEYQVLVDEFSFDIPMLQEASLNALHASFLSDVEKNSLEMELRSEFQRLMLTQ